MDQNTLQTILAVGETVAVEFKRCGNGIESDTYETVCSFLNRFGGDIFLGVLDDGTVMGLPEKAAPGMVKNFISVISNPNLFSPTVYLAPEIIMDEERRTIIHIRVPSSGEVHSYKKVIYDRVNDSDVKVTATTQIAQMYIRKQNIYTERRIYPYVTLEDLRLDLLPRVRQLAVNYAGGGHPWTNLSDEELLISAGLYGVDHATGQRGYNLAGIMLLGKDPVILDVCPAYITDALLRKVDVDRYDDREIIRTNLIESYDALMGFARKHLLDKFYLEDVTRVSLRNILAREMISNTLMHREFTSSFMAKFVIEKDRMYVENASRALGNGYITPENMQPDAKNPIIASFFRTIGLADNLGSGTRKLFKYSKYYSGKDPELMEGDVFRINVPLDDAFSFDYSIGKETGARTDTKTNAKISGTSTETDTKTSIETDTKTSTETGTGTKTKYVNNAATRSTNENRILDILQDNPLITMNELSAALGLSRSGVQYIMDRLKEKGLVKRIGAHKNGSWSVNLSAIHDTGIRATQNDTE